MVGLTWRRSSGLLALLACADALARGASPYLPMNVSPEMDRKIQRVMLLGDKPVMRRPIAAAAVLDALPKACSKDKQLCEEVRTYLKRFMHKGKLTHARVSAAATDGESTAVLPNEHGLDVDSPWEVRAHGYYQPNDYLLISAGVIAREEETIATDSVVSFGADFAQLDIGFRDHWLSPLNDSASLISTQAPTMPSITLSNYTPFTALGLSYEVFMAEMSRQEGIVFEGGTTSGSPRLAGLQLVMEPAEGYSLAVSRETQYGGGARGGSGLSDFMDALFTGSNQQDAAGGSTEATNRLASITSSILFPGRTPFAVHIEYAGEDNAFEGRYRLGATNLSLGVDFPKVWKDFDFSYEASEWQNSWYVHHLYAEGLTNRDHVIGHWFGDNRQFGDAIGGSSHMVRAGWRLRSGDYLQATYRTLAYDSDWAGTRERAPYDRMQWLELDYSTVWRGRAIDAKLDVGRDVFGESFARLGAAFDFARTSAYRPAYLESDEPGASNTEVFVDLGAQRSEVREVMLDLGPNVITGPATNYHVAIGARRRVSERSDLGVRLEVDRIDAYDLFSVRAVDYRYRLTRKLGISGFFGAGRYDIGLPAYGYYFGGGLQYMDLFRGWDLGLDYRYHEKLTRDKVLPSDPPVTLQLPRRVFDIRGLSLYLSRRW
jgi:Capsule assembly protein Wzi